MCIICFYYVRRLVIICFLWQINNNKKRQERESDEFPSLYFFFKNYSCGNEKTTLRAIFYLPYIIDKSTPLTLSMIGMLVKCTHIRYAILLIVMMTFLLWAVVEQFCRQYPTFLSKPSDILLYLNVVLNITVFLIMSFKADIAVSC